MIIEANSFHKRTNHQRYKNQRFLNTSNIDDMAEDAPNPNMTAGYAHIQNSGQRVG
jgi:hypothetical protein